MLKIASNGGIGNRMRTLVGYAAVHLEMGKPIPPMVWLESRHAPANLGAFLIAGAELIDMDYIDSETVVVPGVITISLLYRTYNLNPPSEEKIREAYGLIGFSDEVKKKAESQYSTAIHLRMTDVSSIRRYKAVRSWIADADRERTAGPIYLACDESAYYEQLCKDFPVVNSSSFEDIPGSLRKTSIIDAAADMLRCVNADFFVGSKGSSFSEMIVTIRQYREKQDHLLL